MSRPKFRGPSPSYVVFDEIPDLSAVNDAISRHVHAAMAKRAERLEAELHAALAATPIGDWYRIHVVERDGHPPTVACGLTPLSRYPLHPPTPRQDTEWNP